MTKAPTKPATKPAVTKAAATKTATKAAAPKLVDGIFVRSLSERFCRAGFTFTREGLGLLLADLSKEQLAAIEGEPMLSIQYVEVPATEADDQLLAEQEAADGAKDGANDAPPAETTGAPASATGQE